MLFRILRDKTRARRRRFRTAIRKKILLRGSNERIFIRIYRRNWWGSKESRSGQGSEIAYTLNLRKELPNLLREYDISVLLDAPCGDFNWMSQVMKEVDVEYIGGDIVEDLIYRNNQLYKKENITFHHMDITRHALPAADLMIVRDCLFHFSYRDIYLFLQNFAKSEINLLLTSTHVSANFKNSDIRTGDYRKIDLFSPPFCFPNALCRIADYLPRHPPREMCLFTRKQVLTVLPAMALHLRS